MSEALATVPAKVVISLIASESTPFQSWVSSDFWDRWEVLCVSQVVRCAETCVLGSQSFMSRAACRGSFSMFMSSFFSFRALCVSQQWYVKLALKLLWERQLGAASEVEGYLNVLPAQGSFDTLIHWTDEVIEHIGVALAAALPQGSSHRWGQMGCCSPMTPR